MSGRVLFFSIISIVFATSTAAAQEWPTSWQKDRPWTGYIQVDTPPVVQKADTNVLYLNRCVDGCTLTPGYDDSRTNHSSIIQSTVSIPPFAYGDSSWNLVMECVRELYAPFNIEITDVEPVDSPHFEAIVAGDPADAGFDPFVGGVSPFNCGVIDNAITYSFAEVWGNSPRIICEVVAQETAHAFGLDHEFYCPDPMTYLNGCGAKSFQNYNADCGEDSARPCQCGGFTQNSYQRIMNQFGAGQVTPPQVTITEPQDSAQVIPRFAVRADIIDNFQVVRAELHIDGELVDTRTTPPWEFTAPDLPNGAHEIEVRGFDNAQASDSQVITVMQRDECASASACDNAETCVEGRCVLGPGSPGGLGEVCASSPECASGSCGQDSSGAMYCVEACQVGGDGCPCGFDCLPGPAGGVCWPNGEECGGGCTVSANESGTTPLVPIVFGIALGALFLFRRRD